MYKIKWTKRADKDKNIVSRSGFKRKVTDIMGTIEQNPFKQSQGFEKLKGLKNTYSRQINDHHRVVYEILPNAEGAKDPTTGEPYKGIAKILSMWTHYESGRKI